MATVSQNAMSRTGVPSSPLPITHAAYWVAHVPPRAHSDCACLILSLLNTHDGVKHLTTSATALQSANALKAST